MTSHYTIITAWIDSCKTEEQLDTVSGFINERLMTDEKQRDDIIIYLADFRNRKAWVSAKAALRWRKERFPADDEYREHQPSDIIW